MSVIGKAFAGAVITAGLTVLGAGTAGAHVHAFTPLGCLTTDNPNSGANVGFANAADAAAPLSGGVIPQNASGKLPSGGQGAENACN
jgi:hypothetical protein